MTIIAAYAEPCRRLALMMIPALAHGWSADVPPAMPGVAEPASAVTRAVTVPSPGSGWRTK